MRWGAGIALAISGTGAPLLAQDAGPPRFLACVDETIRDNRDNPFIDLLAIVTCGERHIPPRQSCVGLQYLLPHTSNDCAAQDHAYWSGQLALWQAQPEDAGGQASALFQPGLDRCAGDPDLRLVCETEVYWREVLGFMSSDVRAAIFGPATP